MPTDVTPNSRTSTTRVTVLRDHDVLGVLLAIHAAEGRVLDASWGSGGIWDARLLQQWQPVRLDKRPEKHPDVVGDWNDLWALFECQDRFRTIVWDPPHLSDAGAGLVGRARWASRYGTATEALRSVNVCHLFDPFLRSARTVLVEPEGTLIVKLADQVHGSALQFQPFELRRVALEHGWLACDYKVRHRKQMPHNTTKVQRHIRRGETFWMVFHSGDRCPGEGIEQIKVCAAATDGHMFRPRRPGHNCCSPRCRQRLHRARS